MGRWYLGALVVVLALPVVTAAEDHPAAPRPPPRTVDPRATARRVEACGTLAHLLEEGRVSDAQRAHILALLGQYCGARATPRSVR